MQRCFTTTLVLLRDLFVAVTGHLSSTKKDELIGFWVDGAYPFAQLLPEPCFWLKWDFSPYLHLPDLAALLILWLITLGSMSMSTALEVKSVGFTQEKSINYALRIDQVT